MKWLLVKSKFRAEVGMNHQIRLFALKRARVLDFDKKTQMQFLKREIEISFKFL